MGGVATHRAYLGLGSNLGDKRAMIEAALGRLAATPGIGLRRRSSLYRTPPWGKTDQDWFLNGAAEIETTLDPHALLAACLDVEQSLGRERRDRWGPRTIDIDLLAYGDAALHDDVLTLPHKHLLERAFVLAPLAEIAPDLTIAGIRIATALSALDATGISRDRP